MATPEALPVTLTRRSQARRLPRIRLGRIELLGLLLWACLAAVLLFLMLPVVAIFLNSSPGRLLDSLGERSSMQALLLSLQTSAVALAFVVALGTPAAYRLAGRPFRGRALATTLIELPLVLPPAVAGIGLLAALGPRGLLGPLLGGVHVQLVLARAGVVVALAFVAFPFYVRQAQAAFEAVERSYIEAALALGARPWPLLVRIAIPLARPGLAAGLALAWGRALGEFGATLMFAGSVQGVTQTLPLAIYGRFATDFSGALALSALLVAVSLALLLTVKLLSRSAVGTGGGPAAAGSVVVVVVVALPGRRAAAASSVSARASSD
jgi:molybdate transport system permease protein